jgi:antirestriction protein ArdC
MKNDKFDIYEVITNKIIAQLEGGNIPWLKPWNNSPDAKSTTRANLPFNGFSGRNYNGMNLLLLGCSGHSSNAWYSFKQVKELGGNVKAGEKSTMVIFWQFSEKKDASGNVVDKIPFLRYYNVFNYDQCENLPLPKQVEGKPIAYTSLDSMIKDDLDIKLTHGGNQAFYSPSVDVITMPMHEAFTSPEHYDATILHELTHATGHTSRCNRDFKNRFGSEAYAFEELVAELGSAFLSANLNVKPLLQHNAAYIQSWLKVLKGDKKAIITASSQATKACAWVLDILQADTDTEETAIAA